MPTPEAIEIARILLTARYAEQNEDAIAFVAQRFDEFAAAEREACAKVAESLIVDGATTEWFKAGNDAVKCAAAAIRERK